MTSVTLSPSLTAATNPLGGIKIFNEADERALQREMGSVAAKNKAKSWLPAIVLKD